MINYRKVDIYECAKWWGLEKPITIRSFSMHEAALRRAITRHRYHAIGFACDLDPYVSLRCDLLKKGEVWSNNKKRMFSALETYTHECAHFIAYEFFGSEYGRHRPVFAAIAAFMYARIPGFIITDQIDDYEVHEIRDFEKKFRWDWPSKRAAIAWAIKTGRELAKQDIGAFEAGAIIAERYLQYIEPIPTKRYFQAALFAGFFLNGLWWMTL